jgi:hypothetical protein
VSAGARLTADAGTASRRIPGRRGGALSADETRNAARGCTPPASRRKQGGATRARARLCSRAEAPGREGPTVGRRLAMGVLLWRGSFSRPWSFIHPQPIRCGPPTTGGVGFGRDAECDSRAAAQSKADLSCGSWLRHRSSAWLHSAASGSLTEAAERVTGEEPARAAHEGWEVAAPSIAERGEASCLCCRAPCGARGPEVNRRLAVARPDEP